MSCLCWNLEPNTKKCDSMLTSSQYVRAAALLLWSLLGKIVGLQTFKFQWKRDIADSTVKHWKDARDKLRKLPSIDSFDTETIDAIRRKKTQTLTAEEALFVRRDIIFNTYNISAFPKEADRFIELHVEGQGIKQFTNFCLMTVPVSQGRVFDTLRTKHGGDGRLNPITIPNMVTEQAKWAGTLLSAVGFTVIILSVLRRRAAIS